MSYSPGNDRTKTTKVASVRKQLGTKYSMSNEGRQETNGGVKGRDGSVEELDKRDWREADYSRQDILKGWRMTGYRSTPLENAG